MTQAALKFILAANALETHIADSLMSDERRKEVGKDNEGLWFLSGGLFV